MDMKEAILPDHTLLSKGESEEIGILVGDVGKLWMAPNPLSKLWMALPPLSKMWMAPTPLSKLFSRVQMECKLLPSDREEHLPGEGEQVSFEEIKSWVEELIMTTWTVRHWTWWTPPPPPPPGPSPRPPLLPLWHHHCRREQFYQMLFGPAAIN